MIGSTVAVRLDSIELSYGTNGTIVSGGRHLACVVTHMDLDDRGIGHIYPGLVVDSINDIYHVSISKSCWQQRAAEARPLPAVGDVVAIELIKYEEPFGFYAMMLDHNNHLCLATARPQKGGKKLRVGQHLPAVVVHADRERGYFDVSTSEKNWREESRNNGCAHQPLFPQPHFAMFQKLRK